MDYLDFELEIGFGSEQVYPVAVVHSPGGEAREAMHSFGELELENHLQALQIALLRSGGQRRQVLTPENEAVQQFGRALFDALLTGEVRSRYDVSLREAARQGKGLRLKLRIQPPELAMLPWEFMYDYRRAEYVCLCRTTPMVRYLELPQVIRPLTVTPPLRILGMIASPSNLAKLDVTQERQRVEMAVADLQAAGSVDLQWLEGQTWRDLQRAMRFGPWHVFHFIGHGAFDRSADEGFIALVDEFGEAQRLNATQLGRLLADHAPLRLALLNACEGARGGSRDIFSSTAAILVRRGLPAVLAMQYEITDRAAIEFARTFYEAIADGMPVDTATTEARQAISIAVANSVEWGTPVLYMRAADGRLFNVQRREPAEEPQDAGAQDGATAAQGVEKAAGDEAQKRKRRVGLHRILTTHFDEESLQTFCFYVGVDYDKLTGVGPAGKVRELIEQLDQAGQTSELVKAGRQLRPDIEWSELEQEPSVAQDVRRIPDSSGARQPVEPETIRITAGEFLMGSDPQKDPLARGEEQPQHSLFLPDYYLARTPVTNTQYLAFVQATGHRRPAHWQDGKPLPGQEEHPVVNVSWYDALAYCRWLAEVTGRPYRLPSEAEWEKGARGDGGRIYPWGDGWDAARCNARREPGDYSGAPSEEGVTSVLAYPVGASPYGALDMAGNVWEWTLSLWGEGGHEPTFKYPYDLADGRENVEAPTDVRRVLRGGSFNYGLASARCACRNRVAPESMNWYVGFRVMFPVK